MRVRRLANRIGTAVLVAMLAFAPLAGLIARAEEAPVAAGLPGDSKENPEKEKSVTWFGNQLTEREKLYYDALKKEEDLTKYAEEGLSLDVKGKYVLTGLSEAEVTSGSYETREDYKKLMEGLKTEVYRSMTAFEYDYPENFWFAGAGYSAEMSFTGSADGYTMSVDTVKLTFQDYYKDVRKDIPDVKAAIDKAVLEIKEKLGLPIEEEELEEGEVILLEEEFGEVEPVFETGETQEASEDDTKEVDEKEIVRAVHDYVLQLGSYSKDDTESGQYHTISGILLDKYEHKTVCEGYAKLTKILLDRMGIPSVLVSGKALMRKTEEEETKEAAEVVLEPEGEIAPEAEKKDEFEQHMWNLVQLKDEKWYLLDATWDDQETPSLVYFLAKGDAMGFSDKKIEEDHVASGELLADMKPEFKYPYLEGSKKPEEEPGEHVHHFSEWKVDSEATCTADGQRSRYCVECGELETEITPALGHVWGEPVIDVAATCTENGQQSRHCDRCGEVTDVEVIPATGHSFGEWTTDAEAGCEAAGQRSHTCSACGIVETEEIPALGHTWGEPVIDVAATCTENGQQSRHCERCGAVSEVEVILATGHSFGEWTTDAEAGCEAAGQRSHTCSACGIVETEEIPALGHAWSEPVVDIAATCTENGQQSRHCERCGAVSEVEVILATGHSFGEWTTDAEAGCEVAGQRSHTCSACSIVETEEIPALGHTWGEPVIDVAATCTENGQQSRHCERCGAVSDEEVILATGHSFGEWVSDGNATCTEDGTETRVCVACGESETRTQEGSATGHSFGEWATDAEAGCEAAGQRSHTCSACGIVETEEIPALGHAWGEPVVDIAATCTENGQQSRHCERCGAVSDEEVILATGHSFGEWVSDGNATCTEDGTETHVCEVCGESETRTQEGSATGHSFGEWTTDAEASCEAAGQRSHTCSACGIVETEEIPALGHAWGEPVVDVAATCTENGQQSRHCERCGAVSDEEVILATGHSFGEWVSDGNATCTENGTETRVCAACGESETRTQEGSATGHSFGEWTIDAEAGCEAAGQRSHTCSACGIVETEEIPALGHVWGEPVVDVAATCTENGQQSRHCERCGAVSDEEVILATGHSFGEWVSDGNATCTEDGTETRVCAACGESETRTQEGSAKGHSFGEWVYDGNATYEADGTETRVCSVCGTKETRVKEGSALQHSWSEEWTIDKAATCTEAGERSHHCTTCDERKDIEEIPAAGHSFGEWTVTKAATCQEAGERFHTCTVCGVTETEIVPQLAHDFSAWSLVNAPTCTEAGTRSRFCSVGGETETQTIPAMGHAFGAWVSDGNATCTQDGTETRTCERCGVKESRYVIGSALGHDFQSFYTVDIPATTETEGVKSRHCSRCEERTDFVSIPVMQENVTTETITDLGTGLSTGANLRALLDTLLTAAEKQELKNGAQVSLRLSGEGISYLTGYDYSQLLRTLNGTGERYFIGEYVSIRLQKTVGTTNTAIREIKNPIRLTIQIPESVKSHSTKVKREFELVRIYNGMVDFMKDLDDSADTITIETDKFTSYAIVYRENEIQEIEQPGTSSGKGTGFTKKGLQDLSSELAALLEYRYPEIFLVSRFAEGEIITKERLQMVADAERYLRRQGFAGSMVHVYGSMASIELRPEDVSRFLEEKTREKICKQLQEYGFTQVALDLRSYAENEQ